MADVLITLRDTAVAAIVSPASPVSPWSLAAAFAVAAGLVLVRRGARPVRTAALFRHLLPRGLFVSPSGRTDIAFAVFGVFFSGVLLGWAVLSHALIADGTVSLLDTFGRPDALLPDALTIALVTLVLWVAYEFAYFLDHYLAHRWRWLWAFHKVHHSAETLTPLTVWRVHPVDSIVFFNFVAVVTGVASGAVRWGLGDAVQPVTLWGANIIAVAALMTIKQLHHSNVWLAFTGPLGRVLLSPAHHQLHHSRAPEHHDRNFGDMLGIFDWMAGTLAMPTRARQPLRFGVDGLTDPHSVKGALLEPFADALSPLANRAFLVQGNKAT